MGPLVSIIIPTFNRKNELDFAISSVMSQSYRNWELIIVDNHSTDGTSELIAELDSEKVKHIKINNYGIIAASRNKGIEMAKGDYIAFLDSDDYWNSSKLEKQINFMKDNKYALVFSYVDIIQEDGSYLYSLKAPKKVTSPVPAGGAVQSNDHEALPEPPVPPLL